MAQSTAAVGILDHSATARASGPNVHATDLPKTPPRPANTGVQDHIRTAVGTMDIRGNAVTA